MTSRHALAGLRRAARAADMVAASAPGRRAAELRFITQARAEHPDADDDELIRRAAELRREFYLDLARRGVEARAKLADPVGAARVAQLVGPALERAAKRTGAS